jgi:periplasmic copper chaperone A
MRILCAAALFVAATVGIAGAQDAKIGALTISEGWARESIGPARTAAGYLQLQNDGDETLSVTGASSTAARHVALHQTIRDGDVMRMRPVAALEIAPGETITLKPGGHHLMFTRVHEPFRQGMEVDVTLTLSDGRSVALVVPVRSLGARGDQKTGHHDHGNEEEKDHQHGHND